MCQGVKRRGLTYDPGAAGGLTGTDTLLEYDKGCPPLCEHREVVHSDQSFSGISGGSQPSLGEFRQLCQLGSLTIKYCGDLIGGAGSFCPMLLGLPALIDHKTMVLHGCFGNGDGIMILFPTGQAQDVYIFRLVLTDSGHYLLPTDDPQKQIEDEEDLQEYVHVWDDHDEHTMAGYQVDEEDDSYWMTCKACVCTN